MANKRHYLIAISIAAILVAALYSSRKNLRYCLTRLADKYGVLDCEFLRKKHFRSINQNLDLLNKEVAGLLDKKGGKVNKDDLAFAPYFDHPASVHEISSDIKRRLHLLTILVNRLKRQDSTLSAPDSEAGLFIFSQNIHQNTASFKMDLPQDIEIINKGLKISNRGGKKVVNPIVIVNDKKKWGDLDSILKSITKPNMADEEKALAIWNFLNANRYHFYPAAEENFLDINPAEFELHDAVKYLNAYGYGFCDDTAANFYLLATKAGLKARIWELSGHVVSEAYYGNGWHLLDSDHMAFYLKRDNKTIAGVEDLTKDPHLIYRVAKANENFAAKEFISDGQNEASLYSTAGDNSIGEDYMASVSEKHNLNFILRPGESFTANWDGSGRYISYGQFHAHVPPGYGSGQFVYQPVLKGNMAEDFLVMDNLKVIEENGSRVLTAVNPAKPAYFVIDFHTPYPITGGSFEVDCAARRAGALSVSFSKDNSRWWKIINKDFTNYFPNGYGQPLYTYWLNFTLLGGNPSLIIRGVKITTTVQLSPHSLPELENGANAIAYTSESPSAQDVTIEFQYKLGKHYQSVADMPQLLAPEKGKDGILFTWTPPKNINAGSPVEYNFQLSARSDFLIPLSPNFDAITRNTGFLVGNQWLNKNQTYYWRVRCRYKDEPWGQSVSGEVIY